ncbi:hypothetical protein HRI_000676100 [Hibiscus trionum]|uniref:Aconitase/3-isopropylmalate dehydratase large subunit alpha/beta/alpha domain-containing protein n=1 Tax=Hibiscus trionum TaxID=183268 RepID=A0A9W7LMF7_HIBTR|nr:hypothetical protein HRI_000676100 [Hibiscus trionum]
MRDAMNKLGGDSNKINPLIPVDHVIDHSVQVDVVRSENVVQAKETKKDLFFSSGVQLHLITCLLFPMDQE